MAVRPTRVRRLRIRRAIQATTFATSIALVGGVWFMAARTLVTLIVGGRAESIRTTRENVGELLLSEDITLEQSDRVVPPSATVLADGMTVVVSPAPGAPDSLFAAASTRRSTASRSTRRPQVWGSGRWKVRAADPSRGSRRSSQELRLPRTTSEPLRWWPCEPSWLGKVHDVFTNARTVGELLSAMGIAPDVHDRVRPSSSTPLHDGSTVVVDRVQILTRELRRAIPFATRTLLDDGAADRSDRGRVARHGGARVRHRAGAWW